MNTSTLLDLCVSFLPMVTCNAPAGENMSSAPFDNVSNAHVVRFKFTEKGLIIFEKKKLMKIT